MVESALSLSSYFTGSPLKLKNQKYMIRTEHNRIKHPTGNQLAIYTRGPRGFELGMTKNKSSDSSYWPADWYSNLKPPARLRFPQILRAPVLARGKINNSGWLTWASLDDFVEKDCSLTAGRLKGKGLHRLICTVVRLSFKNVILKPH